MIKQFECRKQNFICTERAKILKIRFFFQFLIFDHPIISTEKVSESDQKFIFSLKSMKQVAKSP